MTDLRRHVARLRTLMWLAALGAGVACEAAGPQPAPEEAAWVWVGLDATAVSASGHDVCALDREGLASCTGNDTTGITATPTTPLRRVELGPYSACGLGDDGSVVCWGCGYQDTSDGRQSVDVGQCTPPMGALTDVSVSSWWACAVATDSSAQCWGSELDLGADDTLRQGVRDLSFGSFLCAILPDWRIECWDWTVALVPPSGTFRRVEVGEDEACAELKSGGVVCWALGPTSADVTFEAAVLDFDVSDGSACVIRAADGVIECAGAITEWPTPAGRYIDVAVGLHRAYAVRDDGLLVGWGDFSPPDTGGTVD